MVQRFRFPENWWILVSLSTGRAIRASPAASDQPAWMQVLDVARGEGCRRGPCIVGASVLAHAYPILFRLVVFSAYRCQYWLCFCTQSPQRVWPSGFGLPQSRH